MSWFLGRGSVQPRFGPWGEQSPSRAYLLSASQPRMACHIFGRSRPTLQGDYSTKFLTSKRLQISPLDLLALETSDHCILMLKRSGKEKFFFADCRRAIAAPTKTLGNSITTCAGFIPLRLHSCGCDVDFRIVRLFLFLTFADTSCTINCATQKGISFREEMEKDRKQRSSLENSCSRKFFEGDLSREYACSLGKASKADAILDRTGWKGYYAVLCRYYGTPS